MTRPAFTLIFVRTRGTSIFGSRVVYVAMDCRMARDTYAIALVNPRRVLTAAGAFSS